uniref:Uncharacterized protein n=1 Tax=Arundo donax TaxID=35708 RepID=A0A0A9HLX2_ARUDO
MHSLAMRCYFLVTSQEAIASDEWSLPRIYSQLFCRVMDHLNLCAGLVCYF